MWPNLLTVDNLWITMTIETINNYKKASIWLGLTVFCEYGKTNIEAMDRLFLLIEDLGLYKN